MSRLIPSVREVRQGHDQHRRLAPPRAVAVALVAVAGFGVLAAQSKVKTLPSPDSSNYYPFGQINKSNVSQLEMAWFYPYAAPTFSPVFASISWRKLSTAKISRRSLPSALSQ